MTILDSIFIAENVVHIFFVVVLFCQFYSIVRDFAPRALIAHLFCLLGNFREGLQKKVYFIFLVEVEVTLV